MNLASGVAVDGSGGIDRISNFEVIIGSAFGNSITGSAQDEVLVINTGGNDTVDGGAGYDTLNLFTPSDIDMDLSMSAYSYGIYSGTVRNVEHIITGSGSDDVRGSGAAEFINSNGGDDYVEAGAGNDRVDGAAGDDYLLGQGGSDTLVGETRQRRAAGCRWR